jgi:hypothetical protein
MNYYNISAETVMDVLEDCQGICLDDDEYEFVYLAMRICELFDLEIPDEWPAILKKGRS